MWTVCDACGSVVADQDRHEQWHNQHDIPAEPATPADVSPPDEERKHG